MALESGEPGPAVPPGRDPVTGLWPGQSTPLATLTPTDQGGALVIGAALALIFGLISFFIRLYVRVQFQRGFARDDAIAAASMVFFIVQSGLVFGEVRHGFGKTVEDIPAAGLVALQKVSPFRASGRELTHTRNLDRIRQRHILSPGHLAHQMCYRAPLHPSLSRQASHPGGLRNTGDYHCLHGCVCFCYLPAMQPPSSMVLYQHAVSWFGESSGELKRLRLTIPA